MHAGYMHDLDIQAFAICLLNFIYVFNVRRGVRAASEDSTIACFLRDISELLIAANEPGQTGAKKILEQQDASTQTASQLQLEVVKDAWRRAADSARANET